MKQKTNNVINNNTIMNKKYFKFFLFILQS